MIKNIFLFIITLAPLLFSCRKTTVASGDNTAIILATTGAWRLISSTTTDQSIPRYQGNTSDSIRITWKWAANGNFLLDSIYSYIGGSMNKYSVVFTPDWASATTISLQQHGDQDTLKCSPAWKPGLSNIIIVKSIDLINSSSAVLSINSINGNYAEIDSLGKVP